MKKETKRLIGAALGYANTFAYNMFLHWAGGDEFVRGMNMKISLVGASLIGIIGAVVGFMVAYALTENDKE
jgi:hypothetical protein